MVEITETMIRYARATLEARAEGFFLATLMGSAEVMTAVDHARWACFIYAVHDRLAWSPRADRRLLFHEPTLTRSCLLAGRARLVVEMLDAGLVTRGLIHGLPTEAVDSCGP
jgi:hypothetical protein